MQAANDNSIYGGTNPRSEERRSRFWLKKVAAAFAVGSLCATGWYGASLADHFSSSTPTQLQLLTPPLPPVSESIGGPCDRSGPIPFIEAFETCQIGIFDYYDRDVTQLVLDTFNNIEKTETTYCDKLNSTIIKEACDALDGAENPAWYLTVNTDQEATHNIGPDDMENAVKSYISDATSERLLLKIPPLDNKTNNEILENATKMARELSAEGLKYALRDTKIHFSTLCTNEGKLSFSDAVTDCDVTILNKNDGSDCTASFLDDIDSPVSTSLTYCVDHRGKKSFAQCLETVLSPDNTKPSQTLKVDTNDDGNHVLKEGDIKKAIDMYIGEVTDVLDKKTLVEINKNANATSKKYGSGDYCFQAP